MIVLNDAQAVTVESLLTKMLINDTYSVSQLEEAIAWFQEEGGCFAVPPLGVIGFLARLSRYGAKP